MPAGKKNQSTKRSSCAMLLPPNPLEMPSEKNIAYGRHRAITMDLTPVTERSRFVVERAGNVLLFSCRKSSQDYYSW
jgi:hypothetical protein